MWPNLGPNRINPCTNTCKPNIRSTWQCNCTTKSVRTFSAS